MVKEVLCQQAWFLGFRNGFAGGWIHGIRVGGMQFITRKRRSAPTVIIISLIDVLIVVLIFLMVTTTFKQQPSIKLALPESTQGKPGATENSIIVTISKQGPIYFKTQPVTVATLQEELTREIARNPQASVVIRADADATIREEVKVMDAVRAANIKSVSLYTKPASSSQ
jgi:biopolymer transport protein ExbD